MKEVMLDKLRYLTAKVISWFKPKLELNTSFVYDDVPLPKIILWLCNMRVQPMKRRHFKKNAIISNSKTRLKKNILKMKPEGFTLQQVNFLIEFSGVKFNYQWFISLLTLENIKIDKKQKKLICDVRRRRRNCFLELENSVWDFIVEKQ